MRYALFHTRRLHRFLRLPKKGLWPLCFSLFLTACASAPQVAEKSVSQFTDLEPAASPLVTLATSQPDSGIRLLADPSEALQSRLHLAALATTTLDVQYYLWQGDDSGLGLTHEVLAAAERGVRVRVLLDDIYHSGRDSCLLYTSPSPRDRQKSRMPSSA